MRVHERRLSCPWLATGETLDEGELDTLHRWAAADVAEQRALRLLAVRDRSRAELLARMTQWGVGDDSAAEVLSRLVACGAVDDAALAESVVASRRRTGHGRLRARADLQRLSVDETTAGAALAEPDGEGQELERALRELQRRYGGRPTDRRGLARAAAHLSRRGFDSDTVVAALGLDLLE